MLLWFYCVRIFCFVRFIRCCYLHRIFYMFGFFRLCVWFNLSLVCNLWCLCFCHFLRPNKFVFTKFSVFLHYWILFMIAYYPNLFDHFIYSVWFVTRFSITSLTEYSMSCNLFWVTRDLIFHSWVCPNFFDWPLFSVWFFIFQNLTKIYLLKYFSYS